MQTSIAPLSAPRKTGWTGTCSQLGGLSDRRHKKENFFGFLTERTYYQCVTCVMLLSDLHFRVHTAVDGGDTPGWASGDQSVSYKGKDSPLVLIEGFQWGILAWTLQLVSTRQWQEEREKRRNNIRYEPFQICVFELAEVYFTEITYAYWRSAHHLTAHAA